GLVKTQEGLVKIPRTRSTSPHRDTPPTPPSSAATSPVPAVQFRSAAPPSRRAPPTSPSSATPLAVERHPNSPVTSRSASLAGDFQIRLPPRAELAAELCQHLLLIVSCIYMFLFFSIFKATS
uniref:Uncharacterized protein n=1 Tax=Triticum urartu TaxID=4572 RepID=A0A8R7TPT3_TRIUA